MFVLLIPKFTMWHNSQQILSTSHYADLPPSSSLAFPTQSTSHYYDPLLISSLVFQVITSKEGAPQKFDITHCLHHCSICPALQNLLHFTILIIPSNLCKLWTSLVRSILNHSTSSCVNPNICFLIYVTYVHSSNQKHSFEIIQNSTTVLWFYTFRNL